MIMNSDVKTIVESLREKGIIHPKARIMDKMKGTTDGLVYLISVNEEPKYVLKMDNQHSTSYADYLHQSYMVESPLLPKLLYTDPSHRFIVYSFISGTTHFNRGSKRKWLERLVQDLLNKYKVVNHLNEDKWGRLQFPRDSWREFNERSLEGARRNVENVLPTEDYHKVESLLDRISHVENKYLLHGDTGVHNFVFRHEELVGVIDPSPMLGPAIYDFTYAYCSSPDDLRLETLFAGFDLLEDKSMDRSRLIDEVIFQLYCRIGISAKVHPHDLDDYLKAWEHWKVHLT